MNQAPPKRRVLLAEMERRSVFRASAVYGAASFVMLEALRIWAPSLGVAPAVVKGATLIVLLCYPVALWLAWHYEISGEGLDRTDLADSDEIRMRTGQSRLRRWAPTLLGIVGILLLAGSAAQIFLA
jgi:hypothetical protein